MKLYTLNINELWGNEANRGSDFDQMSILTGIHGKFRRVGIGEQSVRNLRNVAVETHSHSWERKHSRASASTLRQPWVSGWDLQIKIRTRSRSKLKLALIAFLSYQSVSWLSNNIVTQLCNLFVDKTVSACQPLTVISGRLIKIIVGDNLLIEAATVLQSRDNCQEHFESKVKTNWN